MEKSFINESKQQELNIDLGIFKRGGVLVTGGTGFLGSYIIKELIERGLRVRAIKRSARIPVSISEEILSRVEWVNGDVLDVPSLQEAMNGMRGVIHAAAIVSYSANNRTEMYQVNKEGTANVMNMALENNIYKVVHISSVAALGRSMKKGMVTSEKKWQDNEENTHYAISKHLAEMEVWRAFGEGLDGTIINPSTILGFGDWNHSSCAIFKNIYKQFPWYSNGMNGFVGVEDVAKAAISFLGLKVDKQRFIVNSGNYKFRDIFNKIADGFDKKRPSKEATPLKAGLAWRFEKFRSFILKHEPLLTKETARIANSQTSFDTNELMQALPGFQYVPIDIIIKDACDKYKKALHDNLLTL